MRLRGICVVLAVTGIGASCGPAALAKKAKTSAVVSSGGAVYAPPAAPTQAASSVSTASTADPTTPPATGAPPAPGGAGSTQLEANTGGQAFGQPSPAVTPVVAGNVAQILPDGMAAAPLGAPVAVRAAIWAANLIVGLPYIYGGGHASFVAAGYDCSGTVSFALHGASLIKVPMNSSDFMNWGVSGTGQWITIYTNPGHVYMEIAGIRLDTSKQGDPHGLSGPQWRPVMKVPPARYHKRFLPGL